MLQICYSRRLHVDGQFAAASHSSHSEFPLSLALLSPSFGSPLLVPGDRHDSRLLQDAGPGLRNALRHPSDAQHSPLAISSMAAHIHASQESSGVQEHTIASSNPDSLSLIRSSLAKGDALRPFSGCIHPSQSIRRISCRGSRYLPFGYTVALSSKADMESYPYPSWTMSLRRLMAKTQHESYADLFYSSQFMMLLVLLVIRIHLLGYRRK